jgi:sortase A
MLLFAGVSLALIGFSDAGVAWLSQRDATIGAATESISLPPGFVSKLEIPRLNASLFVVNAKSQRDFRRGPGFIVGSSSPGQKGNCIIAGHRDLHFRILKDVKVGDDIAIETEHGLFRYRVSSAEVVSRYDRDALRPEYAKQLTLVTCYPFYYIGPAPKRYVVKAYLLSQS